MKKNSSKSPLLNDQNHADPEFYENLPFNKLRNPPKHVRICLSMQLQMNEFSLSCLKYVKYLENFSHELQGVFYSVLEAVLNEKRNNDSIAF